LRYSVFELQSPDGSLCSFAKKDMTTIAAQTRHAMLQAAKSQQTGTADWREEFLAGHLLPGNSGLRSLSYVPLPTTGHEHADGRIRRVLLLSPPGESFIPGLRLATQLLHGQDLQEGARLCRVRADVVTTGIGVYQQYCGSSDAWETAVPAIMPGAVHRNRHNVAALISRAIQYAGLPQPKHIEVLPTPRDAIKYFVPQHLQHRGRVRMRITWNQSVTGPVVLGAGRGYGFGLCERAVARAGD
jgi:CRISPR-associated protein Csb2